MSDAFSDSNANEVDGVVFLYPCDTLAALCRSDVTGGHNQRRGEGGVWAGHGGWGGWDRRNNTTLRKLLKT